MPVARAIVALNGGPPDRPVLVALRALGLGDLLVAVPALRAIGDGFPDHRLVFAGPRALEPLLRLIDPRWHQVPCAPFDFGCRPPLRPEVAVNLHGSGPQSHALLDSLRPRRLIAYAHPREPRWAAGPAWDPCEHEVRRWCRLLEEHGIPADERDLDIVVPEVEVGEDPPTVLHPGAADPARRWPARRWAAVARAEECSGRRVVLTAGPGERELAVRIAFDAGLEPRSAVRSGMTLDALAAQIAAAGRVASADTGVAHLAVALGRPSVVVFGPGDPGRWGPPPDRPGHLLVQSPGHREHAFDVPVDAVVGALAALAAAGALARAAG
ncbi:MAG TPA: glycosyltransferase family 9 protein [Miltoncostaeaceae bacterium]|nr:glycosyltransferase family 9 protein [Miltoncostaeaceae bacterium]